MEEVDLYFGGGGEVDLYFGMEGGRFIFMYGGSRPIYILVWRESDIYVGMEGGQFIYWYRARPLVWFGGMPI